MPQRDDSFIPQHGDAYRRCYSYLKAECIYDITYYFAHHYLQKGDRTIDQMVQAARSGKQNIAEGMADGDTSKEMLIKLLNVAKGSLQELRADYEDYLRVRGHSQWRKGEWKFEKTREICGKINDSAYYRAAVEQRTPDTIANIALILIAQADYLLFNQIERAKRKFLEEGGIKEEMTRARLAHRKQKLGY